MKSNKKKFYVWQGCLTRSGAGDVEIVECFDNLEDAKFYFEKIKKDTNGYNLKPNGRLETWLTSKKETDDDAIDYYEYYYYYY